jgi:hypothetical protein
LIWLFWRWVLLSWVVLQNKWCAVVSSVCWLIFLWIYAQEW